MCMLRLFVYCVDCYKSSDFNFPCCWRYSVFRVPTVSRLVAECSLTSSHNEVLLYVVSLYMDDCVSTVHHLTGAITYCILYLFPAVVRLDYRITHNPV